jgi:hypothetical protein
VCRRGHVGETSNETYLTSGPATSLPQERIVTPLESARSQQSYRHEAFLWRDASDFTASLVAFIRDGLEAGEPIMVAVTPQHVEWLRDALDGQSDQVEFFDIWELGRNPAQLIPAWQQFLDTRSERIHPVRGIGEPIWPGRRPEELLESQLHEALLNISVDPEIPFWLICPYDAETLSAAVVEEAHRSHPVIVDAVSYQGSARYAGREHADSMFATDLPQLAGQSTTTVFTAHSVSRLQSYIRLELHWAGLHADKAARLAAATQWLALSSLHRGATEVTIQIWDRRNAWICEVTDGTTVRDVLLGRRMPSNHDHEGLWHANQLCDLVQIRSSSTGTHVRVHAWK